MKRNFPIINQSKSDTIDVILHLLHTKNDNHTACLGSHLCPYCVHDSLLYNVVTAGNNIPPCETLMWAIWCLDTPCIAHEGGHVSQVYECRCRHIGWFEIIGKELEERWKPTPYVMTFQTNEKHPWQNECIQGSYRVGRDTITSYNAQFKMVDMKLHHKANNKLSHKSTIVILRRYLPWSCRTKWRRLF